MTKRESESLARAADALADRFCKLSEVKREAVAVRSPDACGPLGNLKRASVRLRRSLDRIGNTR